MLPHRVRLTLVVARSPATDSERITSSKLSTRCFDTESVSGPAARQHHVRRQQVVATLIISEVPLLWIGTRRIFREMGQCRLAAHGSISSCGDDRPGGGRCRGSVSWRSITGLVLYSSLLIIRGCPRVAHKVTKADHC